MTEPPSTVDRVEFFFDPMCPYAYQGSKWIREVRAATGLDITWRFFSLEEINRTEGKKHPWERPWSYGFGQMRVGALLRRTGQDLLDRWYAAVGAAFHEDGVRTHVPDVHREVLAGLGLDPGLVDDAIADPTTLDEVRADHDEVVGVHAAWGVPVLLFPAGRALFGPVLAEAPTGPAAVRLWELTLGWLEFPYLYEMQHPKTASDLREIARIFEPYLTARDWESVANPTP